VDSVPKLVDSYMAKDMMVDEFVTHNMPLDKVNEAFDLMHAGKRYLYTKSSPGGTRKKNF